jgi:hypothetical protein
MVALHVVHTISSSVAMRALLIALLLVALSAVRAQTTTTTLTAACANPSAVAYNGNTGRLYAACGANILYINGPGNYGTLVTLSGSPIGLVLNPNSGILYAVFTSGAASVVSINGVTVTTVLTSTQCATATGVAVNPSNGVVYATCNGSNSVVSVDGSGTVSTLTTTCASVSRVAVNPTSGTVYAGCGGTSIISIVGSTVNTIASCGNADGLVVNPTTGTLYAVCYTGGNAVLSVTTGGLVTTLASSSQCASAIGVTVNTATGTVYAACYVGTGTAGSIASISSNGTVSAVLTTSTCQLAAGVTVDPTTGTVYSACKTGNLVVATTITCQAPAYYVQATGLCATDCVASWVTTGACSATCMSDGLTPTYPQTYTVTMPSANGGVACLYADGQLRYLPCNTQACPAVGSSTGASSSSSSSTGGWSSSTGGVASSTGASSSTGGMESSSTGVSAPNTTAKWVAPDVTSPPPLYNASDPNAPLPVWTPSPDTTVLVSIDADFASIVNATAFSASLLVELAGIVGNGYTPSDFTVNSLVAGSIRANVTTDQTAAQILQQFGTAYTSGMVTLDPSEYPIFSRTQFVILAPDATPADLVYGIGDTSCGGGSNCLTIGGRDAASLALYAPVCSRGVCGCGASASSPAGTCDSRSLSVPINDSQLVCVSGVTLPGAEMFPDICVSRLNTAQRLVYSVSPPPGETLVSQATAGAGTPFEVVVSGTPAYNGTGGYPLDYDECTRRGAINIFPRRRYCRDTSYTYGVTRSMFQGVFGGAGDGLIDVNGTVVIVNGTVANTTLLAFAIGSTTDVITDDGTGLKSVFAYVSNLYGGNNSIFDQTWARVEWRYEYAVGVVKLTRLTFLDSVEHAADWFYANNTRHYLNCTAIGYGGPSYAFLADDDITPTCGCRRFTELNPSTQTCEPGCTNGGWGAQCQLAADTCVAYTFNPATMAFLRSSDCTPVCIAGYTLEFGDCVPVEQPYGGSPITTSSSSSSSNDTVLIVTSVVLGVACLALLVLLVRSCVRRRRHKRRIADLHSNVASLTRGGSRSGTGSSMTKTNPPKRSQLDAILRGSSR